MRALGPQLQTPRAAKKLANLYRLARIGISESILAEFVDHEYRVVQILLAVLVGDPAVAGATFAAIRGSAPGARLADAIADPGCARVAQPLAKIEAGTGATLLGLDFTALQPWCKRLARYSFHLPDSEAPDI